MFQNLPLGPQNGDNQTLPFQRIFEAQSGPILLLSPELVILAVTDAYLRETFTDRENILGKFLFDVFPDNPDSAYPTSTVNLRASIEQVFSSRKPHKMEIFQYDIPDPESPGKFLERYWSTTNVPLLNEQGEITNILHETLNVSEKVKAKLLLEESKRREQAALAQAEQTALRLERLFDQAPAGLAMLEGPDLVFKVVNSAYQNLFPGRALLNKPILEALPEFKDQAVYGIMQQVYTTGETFEGKEVLVPLARYSGQPAEDIYWNFIYQALFDAQGKVTGILIFALDVTEFVDTRRQVEKSSEELQTLNRELEERVKRRTSRLQLVQAEAEIQSKRLTSLFMQAPASICILGGPDLVYELVNPNYAQLFPGRELLGKPILEALPEIKDNAVYKNFRDVYETGIAHEESELLIPFLRPEDGVLEQRYFRYVLQARFNEQGQVDGVVVFALEITENVEARKAVEVSEKQLRLVTDALPVLISYLDKDQKYRFANKAYEVWFPRKADEMIGKTAQEVLGTKAYDHIKSYISKALNGERVDFEITMPYREDFIRHVHISYVPDMKNDAVLGIYSLVSDITEQVEARLALEESEKKARSMADKLVVINQELQGANAELGIANKQLIHTNTDLDNFIYTASHDLRSPIANIERLLVELKLELPKDDEHESEVKRITGMMQGAIDRFKKTITSLTEISMLQKNDDEQATLVNLAELVNEVRYDLEYLIQDTKAQIEVDMEKCTSVAFSEKNLRSIVYNLISNAIKYRHPDRLPRITLRCYREEAYLVVEIKDNGLGLSAKNQEKLFTMFRRFHDHVEGSGVGLYMVKRITDNAGGKIDVKSTEGEGTVFKVYLKVYEE